MTNYESATVDKKSTHKKHPVRRTIARLALVGALAGGGVACAPGGNHVEALAHSNKTSQTTPNNSADTVTTTAQSPETTQNAGNFIQSFPNQETITSDGKPVEIFTDDQGNYSVKDVVLAHLKDENIWLVTGDENKLAAFTPREADAEKYGIPTSWSSEHENRQAFLSQTGHRDGDSIPSDTYYVNVDLDNVDYSPAVGAATMKVEFVTKTPQGVDRQKFDLVFGTINKMDLNGSNKQFVYTLVSSAREETTASQ